MLKHFKVHVRAGGSTGIAHQGNRIALTHQVAHFNQVFAVVPVAGHQPITMSDFYQRAIARPFSTPAHHAAGHGNDLVAGAASEVDALMKKEEAGADSGGDRSRFEEEARRRVSLGLLISEIIQRDQLQVDPERVRQTIENLAQSYEKPEEVVQWYYSNQEMLAGVQTLVMEDTVVEWISGKAKVEDTSMSFDELMQS